MRGSSWITLAAYGIVVAALLLVAAPVVELHGQETPAATWPLSLKWQRCPGWYCETGWYASPAVADVDGDGQMEVLWGGYTLMAVDGNSGAIRWIRPQGSSSRLWPGIVAADLDGNGSTEVVTASGNGRLTAYGPGLASLTGFPQNPTGNNNEIRSLAVADLDGDGDQELVICSTRSDNQWFVYEHTGALRPGWPKMTDSDANGYAAGCFNENVGVADLDGDGRGEILGPNDTHYMAAFHDDGSPVRASPIYGAVGGQNKPWARVGLHVAHAVDLRGYANCGVEHRPNMANTAPSIADLDGDGTLEIVIVGNVYNCGANPYASLYEMPFVLDADRTRWQNDSFDWTDIPIPDAMAAPLSEDYSVIENNAPNPVLADLDGDGQREIIFPSYDGRIHAYWLDKTEHGNWPVQVYDPAEGFFRFATEPTVVDLDDDGKAEVIFATWTQNGSGRPGRLHIVSWDGNPLQAVDLPYDPNNGRGGALAAPTVANIDGDADLEVVVGTINRGLVAFDLGNTGGARILWGTGRGSYQRTGLAPAIVPPQGSLDGSSVTFSPLLPRPGATMTYTLHLVNPGALLPAVRVTDTLPVEVTLVAASVTASSGSAGVAGNQLTWQGAVASSAGVTVTYSVQINAGVAPATVIRNALHLDDGAGRVQVRQVTAIALGESIALPVLAR